MKHIQIFYNKLNAPGYSQARAVQKQMVIMKIVPFSVGVIVVVIASFFIPFSYFIFRLSGLRP